MEKDNGGNAFPIEPGDRFCGSEGMMMRDYFAAKALQGMIAGGRGLAITTEQFAEQSYKLADAMIKARGE